MSSSIEQAPASPARWITWRSVLLGTVAVILVCGLTPYNDYVVANTFLVGSYLPIIVAIWLFLLIVLVNAPLHCAAGRRRQAVGGGPVMLGEGGAATGTSTGSERPTLPQPLPEREGGYRVPAVYRLLPAPLSSGELAVMLGMMLVACSLPSSGLMRVIIPMLVAPFYFGGTDESWWRVFTQLDLPGWLYPVEISEEGQRSWIISSFYSRLQEDMSVPYWAWAAPLAGWGVFIFGLFATLIGMLVVIRRQWVENERLPFPIVQLQLALIEPPRAGRALNPLFRSWGFWIALATVFVLQSLSVLHQYFPRHVPEVPLSYDLSGIFANEPWVHFHDLVKRSRVFFTFIGITYFIQSRVSFSLWSIFLITQIVNVQQRMMQNDIPSGAWMDQHLGASIAFVAGFLWIGRQHWWMVIRQAFAGAKSEEHTGDYLPNRVAVFLILGGLAVMIGWLWMLQVQVWVAVVSVGFILMAQLVVARVVAETGIPFFRAFGQFQQVYSNLSPELMSTQSVFFAQKLTLMGPLMTREALAPFALHALAVHDQTGPPRVQRYGFMAMLAWALVLGFVVASASSLWTYYTHATPLTTRADPTMNKWGSEDVPNMFLVRPVKEHADGRYPPKPYNSWLHMGIGAGVMGVLQVGALRWASWPFMPVGYLISMTWYAQVAWFSIMLGWLCKVLIVKYGGARLFQAAKPVFVGIIFGEALAAGFWLLVTMYLAQAGFDYQVVRLLPE